MKSTILRGLLICALSSAGVLGCGGRSRVVTQGPQYTLTNLRIDNRRPIVDSVNYQSQRLLPVCSQVEVHDIGDREIRFTVLSTGEEVTYRIYKGSRQHATQHLSQIIGSQCPDIANMSTQDQSGIAQGQLFPGMSKQGVAIALGYPPDHKTPSLNADRWVYWNSKMGTFDVNFVNGFAVVDEPAPVEPAEPTQEVAMRAAVTLVNLRANKEGVIESINYTSLGLIPRCTEVKITDADSDEIEFTVTETGVAYSYELHDSSRMPIVKHDERIFGDTCPSDFSEVDQSGIAQGTALPGMSKAGVLAALGYPPDHETPSTQAAHWKYWRSRLDTFTVHFKGDTVASVED